MLLCPHWPRPRVLFLASVRIECNVRCVRSTKGLQLPRRTPGDESACPAVESPGLDSPFSRRRRPRVLGGERRRAGSRSTAMPRHSWTDRHQAMPTGTGVRPTAVSLVPGVRAGACVDVSMALYWIAKLEAERQALAAEHPQTLAEQADWWERCAAFWHRRDLHYGDGATWSEMPCIARNSSAPRSQRRLRMRHMLSTLCET